MFRCPDRLAFWIWSTRWSRLPAPLWLLVASPLLSWAAGDPFSWRGWFHPPRR